MRIPQPGNNLQFIKQLQLILRIKSPCISTFRFFNTSIRTFQTVFAKLEMKLTAAGEIDKEEGTKDLMVYEFKGFKNVVDFVYAFK